VNADDFGRSRGVNEGIARAHEQGIVTSVSLRHFTEGVRYCGDFFGQTAGGEPLPEAITVESLLDVLRALQAGTTELCCHPGYAEGLDSSYREERARELDALCDSRVRAALDELGIELVSFDAIAVP
jgi:hypothetical protein